MLHYVTMEETEQNPIERAEAAAARLEAANAKAEELAARALLGGRSDAGKEPEKPKPLSDQEYARRALAGEL